MTSPSTSLHTLASLEKHPPLFRKHWPKILLTTIVFYCEPKGVPILVSLGQFTEVTVASVLLKYSVVTNKTHIVQ